jgi:hypothetical protein
VDRSSISRTGAITGVTSRTRELGYVTAGAG